MEYSLAAFWSDKEKRERERECGPKVKRKKDRTLGTFPEGEKREREHLLNIKILKQYDANIRQRKLHSGVQINPHSLIHT